MIARACAPVLTARLGRRPTRKQVPSAARCPLSL